MSQQFKVDPRENEVRTEINSVFRSASSILGWGFESAGIGINEEIIDQVLKGNKDLSVHLASEDAWYKIKNHNIHSFMKNYVTAYKVKKTQLFVLPLTWFDKE